MDISKILLQRPIPIYSTISREKGKNLNCYFIDEPQFEPYKSGNFIANVAQGGSVNCEYIRFCAHGNGTHTECFGHVSKQFYSIQNVKVPFLMLAQVVTAVVSNDNSPLIQFSNIHAVPALILRVKYPDSYFGNYSGKNPPYIKPEAILELKKKGIQHLLTNLPSIDPENDNGKLEAHLAFWGMENRESLPLYPNDTITELCDIPNDIKDGLYGLHLGLSPFESDAVPSMPVLFPEKIF
jgi:kynurenine formamidase